MRDVLPFILTGLAMLCGCGFPTANPYLPSNGPLPANPPEVPAGTPNYLISANVAANIPVGSYGITTDGVTWFLEWQGDGIAHRFTGDIYCPVECRMTYVGPVYNYSDIKFSIIAPNHFQFQHSASAKQKGHLEFDATKQPIVFDLRIDDQAATSPHTTFPSENRLVTTEVMPFGLISSNVQDSLLK